LISVSIVSSSSFRFGVFVFPFRFLLSVPSFRFRFVSCWYHTTSVVVVLDSFKLILVLVHPVVLVLLHVLVAGNLRLRSRCMRPYGCCVVVTSVRTLVRYSERKIIIIVSMDCVRSAAGIVFSNCHGTVIYDIYRALLIALVRCLVVVVSISVSILFIFLKIPLFGTASI